MPTVMVSCGEASGDLYAGALATELPQHRVDLGDLRPPHRFDLVPDRAREVVPGARLGREKAEEDVRERHRKTISRLI
jgi:hypothetical protein